MTALLKRDIAVSMRLREDDLGLIDRGAALHGLSRTEFMRRAALRDAGAAILNAAMVALSPEAFAHFNAVMDGPVPPLPAKLRERLERAAPWVWGPAEDCSV